MCSFEIYCKWLVQTNKHAHMHVHHSDASVGLTQARPNYNCFRLLSKRTCMHICECHIAVTVIAFSLAVNTLILPACIMGCSKHSLLKT